jgi:hypothetical protein
MTAKERQRLVAAKYVDKLREGTSELVDDGVFTTRDVGTARALELLLSVVVARLWFAAPPADAAVAPLRMPRKRKTTSRR